MHTKIHTTKKLEKLVVKLIQDNQDTPCGLLGKWNATVLNINRKKCWIITNGLTKYNVVLVNIKSSDLKIINQIFKNALHEQLVYDGVKISLNKLDTIVGTIQFLKTDNDRKTTGFQNYRISELEYWKHEFGTLENMPMNDLVNRMNRGPIHIGDSKKLSDYTDSVTEIKKLLE